MTEDFKTHCLNTLAKEDEKLDLKLVEDFAFLSETEEKFPIPIEKLVEWGMDARKSHAFARLTKSFVPDVDFCRTFGKTSSEGGRPRKLINLSLSCFKILCAQAQNERGKMLLRYLLIVEHLWKEYTQARLKTIQEEKNQLSAQLTDEQKSHKELQSKYNRAYGRRYHMKFGHHGPTFYIVTSGVKYADGNERIKPGSCGCRSKNSDPAQMQSLDKRLANHRGLWPGLRVRFIVYFEDALLLEKIIKRAYRTKNFSNSHEMIIGEVPVDEIIQKCKSALEILDTSEEKPTFRMEERLELFNSEENSTEELPENTIPSDVRISDSNVPDNHIKEDENPDHVEINHTEFTTTQIQSLIDSLPNLDMNGLKTLCRKFKILMNKRRKSQLKKDLQTLFQKALGQLSEDTKEESKAPEPIVTSYDPENLPRGISFIKKNGKTVGLKLTVGLGGNVYESTFNDSSKSMAERFQEALQLQQDLISEFNLVGSVDWENRKRQQVVRLGICVGCGKEVSKTSSLCQSCASKQDSTIPPKDRLLAMLREHKGNLSAVGRDLQRTDAAVRKWLIGYGFSREEIKNRSFL
jgi:hypothetical protein